MIALEGDSTSPQIEVSEIFIEEMGAMADVQGTFSDPCYLDGGVEPVPESTENIGHSDHNYHNGRTVEEEVKYLHDMLRVMFAQSESLQQQIDSLKSELACCTKKCLELDSLKMGSKNIKEVVEGSGVDPSRQNGGPPHGGGHGSAGCCGASGSSMRPCSCCAALGRDPLEPRRPEDCPPGRTVAPGFEFVSVGTVEPCVLADPSSDKVNEQGPQQPNAGQPGTWHRVCPFPESSSVRSEKPKWHFFQARRN